jgi:hypothetical protein
MDWILGMFLKKEKEDLVLDALDKYFDTTYARTIGDVTTFYCKVHVDYWLKFPFYTKDIKNANPYDVVNSIWEHILNKNML